MNSCTNCANAVFDEIWGEYKCKKMSGRRIYNVDERNNCEMHEKKKEGT